MSGAGQSTPAELECGWREKFPGADGGLIPWSKWNMAAKTLLHQLFMEEAATVTAAKLIDIAPAGVPHRASPYDSTKFPNGKSQSAKMPSKLSFARSC